MLTVIKNLYKEKSEEFGFKLAVYAVYDGCTNQATFMIASSEVV